MNFEEELFGDERLVDPAPTGRDQIMVNDLRPKTLDEYIGQKQVRKRLTVSIGAAKKRGEPLDHLLFHGFLDWVRQRCRRLSPTRWAPVSNRPLVR